MRNSGLIVSLMVLSCAACGPSSRDMGGDGSPDSGITGDGNGGGGGGGGGDTVYVYANTATALYRIDPDSLAVQKVGDFGWGSVGSDQMTDIAIDKNGRMLGVSFTNVYRVDPQTAQAALLSSGALTRTFNGLSFVPADQLGQSGDDVLVGTQNSDGKVFRIDPMTGSATEIGNMGSYVSSGDLVAIAGFGTVQTVTGTSSDRLARLAPSTFAATPIGSGTGYSQIWGIAYWKDKVYGFTNNGQFVLIDPQNGGATLVTNTPGMAWWGAAVTTIAPVLQ